jgi:osmotically-inducible protein OsmY
MKLLPLLLSTQLIMLSLTCVTHAQQPANAEQSSTSSSTGANKGDDKSDSITPFSQSNADADLKVTQSLRQAIEKQDGLSQNAKNIKIITTTDHTVYLKGVVDSEDERNRVVALAKPIIGDLKFKNFLKLPSETHTSNTQ